MLDLAARSDPDVALLQPAPRPDPPATQASFASAVPGTAAFSAVSRCDRSATTKSPKVDGKRRAVSAMRTFTRVVPTKSGSTRSAPAARARDDEAITGIGGPSVGWAGRRRKTWFSVRR